MENSDGNGKTIEVTIFTIQYSVEWPQIENLSPKPHRKKKYSPLIIYRRHLFGLLGMENHKKKLGKWNENIDT